MKKQEFKEIRIVDNFYQTSSFFPMPLCLIGTWDEEKKETSFGAYSLCFPYYIAGKSYYAMILECRNTSNTCKGLLRHKKCTINFMPYNKKIFKECVNMGFPGETPAEKMKNLHLTRNHVEGYPDLLDDSYQVFECSWDDTLDNASKDTVKEEYDEPYHNFNGITSKFGAHFILKVDKILVKEKQYDALINGVNKNNFPPLATNWGYRDSTNFWCSGFRKPGKEPIPNKEIDLDSIKYACNRADDVVKFDESAMKMLVKIPRPFLKLVLKGCVDWAKQNNCTLITEAEMKIINDKRRSEKGKK